MRTMWIRNKLVFVARFKPNPEDAFGTYKGDFAHVIGASDAPCKRIPVLVFFLGCVIKGKEIEGEMSGIC